MGLFDIFKSNEEKQMDSLMEKMHNEIFPGGNDQFIKEVGEIRKLLNFKYSKDDIVKTYSHASGIFYAAGEKTQDRIIISILHHKNSVVTKDDAITIFNYLRDKFSDLDKKKSFFIIAQRLNCSPTDVADLFIQGLKGQNFSKSEIDESINHWHNKRDEEARALNMSLDDTPAALMEQWTIEYRDSQFKPRDNELKWELLLDGDEIPSTIKELILEFFMPYNIDLSKFLTNQDATSDPYRYLIFENNPLFSRTLKVFQEDRTLKAAGYPDWFYLAFPDVAFWAIKGEGNRLTKEKFQGLTESELVDLSRNQLWEKNLKTIIELYIATGHKLECEEDSSKVDSLDNLEFE